MAVAEGFEPSDGGYPSHAFEACSLGRSDTPPSGSLPAPAHAPLIAAPPITRPIAWQQTRGERCPLVPAQHRGHHRCRAKNSSSGREH
jgi:hypothetical protein